MASSNVAPRTSSLTLNIVFSSINVDRRRDFRRAELNVCRESGLGIIVGALFKYLTEYGIKDEAL